ncbi:hypothetical protein [uncultured Sulfitobacter sp.]|uniref:hypothetical protein n=1 Tax=uncultured Sulfitobacter sp. TaxID=191468 RepID=UPI0030D6E092|tara:strand:- start:126476 stop:126985 length:510 start_codon:yes stop_codon:yes gene_type:complete
MFNSVKRIALATSVSIAALSTAAFASEEIVFSEIDVTAVMGAAENANALDVFPEIVTDLEQAIASRVQTGSDASLPTIKIDIRQISLNGNPMLTSLEGFNEISGVVAIADDNNSIGAQSFAVNIAAYPGDQIVPEGFVAVQPSEDDFYNAMIAGFADTVLQRIDTINTK